MKLIINVIVFSLVLMKVSCSSSDSGTFVEEDPITETPDNSVDVKKLSISVACEGNSWVAETIYPENTGNIVGEGGISNWTDANNKIRTYFYAKTTGDIQVGLKGKFTSTTKLKVTLGSVSKEVEFESSATAQKYAVGTFKIESKGYHFVELEGLIKSGSTFGEISDILLGNATWSSNIVSVQPDWFYWGRRGPSVHLGYTMPEGKNITWFYNELTVPEGMDPIGTYFMANGFADGYFGMQVNSETERRVLFSVWSAYDTQDPNQIPDEYTVDPLGYGTDVTVKEFGGEGSGAQSYLVYNWKAGNTYKFLLRGESNTENTMDYTAYFYAPEVGDWKLIASFRRPFPSNSAKYLGRLHSFLENFTPSMGSNVRKINYSNQWVYDTNGTWSEMTGAKFTVDNTAASGVRFDYDGGADGANFYLRNCGFFSDNEIPNTSFTRTPKGVAPTVDFSKLEVPKIPEEVVRNLLDRSTWTVVDYSSQEDQGGEGDTGKCYDILDNDVNTYWHSCWNNCTGTPPHHIVVDMGESKTIAGFRFIQRQSLSRAVKDIELQVSADNTTWTSIGDFTLANVSTVLDIDLSEAKTFRYFKFIAKTSHDGSDFAAMAEIVPYTN
ncbi:DUF3472 domain-containing protein [Aestuariibaculum marinum]|nr:DUF3472 domain-containing protein [Aestuariibaculum marinum]